MTDRPVNERPTAHGPTAVVPLLRAAHPGPTFAVTAIASLLTVAFGLPVQRGVLVTLAVLAGQLSVGWGNDLVDRQRDRAAGRTDKPLAIGELAPAPVRRALGAALGVCVVLSLSVGWRSGLVHLALAVAPAHAYNLHLKRTVWSGLPYAVAFGAAPAVVSLAAVPPGPPPVWMVVAAATLGLAAHLLNALLDVEADAATGVHGLPHRIGVPWGRAIATVLLVAASVVVVAGPGAASALPPPATWTALAAVGVLALVTLLGPRSATFGAAIGIALVNVALIAARAG
jgi:4-hydroxybenzoate polyprenyltransferase